MGDGKYFEDNMNLLRFFIIIGGAKFDAKNYDLAAKAGGLSAGETRYGKNPRALIRLPVKESRLIESGYPGTYGDGYFTWKSETVNYAASEDVFKKQRELSLELMHTHLDALEEAAIIEFLSEMKNKMPSVSDYCAGDYFVTFAATYGCYDDDDSRCICSGYSKEIVKLLDQIGAGCEFWSEPYEMYFSRLRSLSLMRY